MRLKWIKLFEDYKVNNITEDDIIDTIKNDGKIYVSAIKDLPEHKSDKPVKPVSIDGDDIYIDVNNSNFMCKIENVERIEF